MLFCRRLSIIDINGLLTLYDITLVGLKFELLQTLHPTAPQGKAPVGTGMGLERKEVWDVKWAQVSVWAWLWVWPQL